MPAAGWAAKSGDPVLWVTRDAIPPATRAAITAHKRPQDLRARTGVGGVEEGARPARRARRRRAGSRGADPVANAIAFARFSDGSFGWNVVDPGHGLVFATTQRPLDAAAAAPLSASGTLRPAAARHRRQRAAGAAAGLPARHPARLRQGPRPRRLQPRLADRRRARRSRSTCRRGSTRCSRSRPSTRRRLVDSRAMAEAEQPERLRPEHRVTVDDVRQLMGASTPHFALQLRNRIRKLIAPLPPDDPARHRGRARDRAARADRVLRRGPRRAGAGRPAPAAQPRRGRADALRRGPDARLARRRAYAPAPRPGYARGQQLRRATRGARPPGRCTAAAASPRAAAAVAPRAAARSCCAAASSWATQHGEHDLARQLRVRPASGLGAQCPDEERAEIAPHLHQGFHIGPIRLRSRCTFSDPMPDDPRRRRPPRRHPRLRAERAVARRPLRRRGCATGCAGSRACRCSARCSTCAPAARACGSSCATSAARCRARCGARTSTRWRAPLADGQRVVAAGGCDYYPGSRAASPSFSFAVADVRVAGEGDLLAQLDRLRRALHAEGLFEPQKRLDARAAAALHRRRDRRGRQGARRRPRRAAAARLGGAARVGVRAGAGSPRRARRDPRAAGPRRAARRSRS